MNRQAGKTNKIKQPVKDNPGMKIIRPSGPKPNLQGQTSTPMLHSLFGLEYGILQEQQAQRFLELFDVPKRIFPTPEMDPFPIFPWSNSGHFMPQFPEPWE